MIDELGTGGRYRTRVAVRRAMRDRDLGPPYTGGRPYGRTRRVTGNTGRHDHHTLVCRDVARYRLGWP